MAIKNIQTIKDLDLLNYGRPFSVELISNDGGIYEKMGQGVITYNEKQFNIYIFEGVFKKKFKRKVLEYKFSDIKDVEFGKYGFKHPYVQIHFKENEYIVFSYYLKIKSHKEQEENINSFFDVLGEIEVEVLKDIKKKI